MHSNEEESVSLWAAQIVAESRALLFEAIKKNKMGK